MYAKKYKYYKTIGTNAEQYNGYKIKVVKKIQKSNRKENYFAGWYFSDMSEIMSSMEERDSGGSEFSFWINSSPFVFDASFKKRSAGCISSFSAIV